MAFLSTSTLTLNGGCMCSAIRYTITVPELSARPLVPRAIPTPINATGDVVTTRLPFIDIDHCDDCRRACGGLLQCWFICPQPWIEFKLHPRGSGEFDATAEGVPYACGDVAHPSTATTEATYLGHYQSSPKIHRCFCSRCGTGLTYCSSKDRGPNWTLGPIVDVAIGTLDRESFERVRPDRHGWWNSGAGWVKAMVEGRGAEWLIRHPNGRVDQEVTPESGSGAGSDD